MTVVRFGPPQVKDDDDDQGGGTLVMEQQAPQGGDPRLRPAPVAVPGTLDRAVPKMPIFQLVRDESTGGDGDPATLVKPDVATHGTTVIPVQPDRPPAPAPQPSAPSWPGAGSNMLAPHPSHPSQPHLQAQPLPAQIFPGPDPRADPLAATAPYDPLGPPIGGYARPRPIADLPPIPTQSLRSVDDGAPAPPKRGLVAIVLGILIAVIVTLAIVVVVTLVRKPDGETAAARPSATERAETAANTAAEAAATTTAEPSPSAAVTTAPTAAPTGPDAAAIAALERMRDSIDRCVKNTTHVLPGTSPPVPPGFAWLKNGPYKPSAHDFITPFFSCTQFRVEEPMPYMIQWQTEKPGKLGTGIAWIDAEGDGTPEKVYGFTAELKKRDVVEFGPIQPIEATRKPKKPN